MTPRAKSDTPFGLKAATHPSRAAARAIDACRVTQVFGHVLLHQQGALSREEIPAKQGVSNVTHFEQRRSPAPREWSRVFLIGGATRLRARAGTARASAPK